MLTSIIALLAAEKLNDDNHKQWKSNLNTILVIDDLRFILQKDCPQAPASNVVMAVRNALPMTGGSKPATRPMSNSWQAYLMYLLRSENMVTVKEIMDSLQSMFGQPSSEGRHETVKFIYNSCMKEANQCENTFST
ncbi:uncharacterized protein LOC111025035 [Momordica charantia]|uniref:Uncharacterized protein LOC111025035 n=1 Tax=Momordica charantia TaxID=3673 RepID=A0A6J1E1B6_MOMCH|nr:uncharacterized protein LOC111025035 [Momordica charantia]